MTGKPFLCLRLLSHIRRSFNPMHAFCFYCSQTMRKQGHCSEYNGHHEHKRRSKQTRTLRKLSNMRNEQASRAVDTGDNLRYLESVFGKHLHHLILSKEREGFLSILPPLPATTLLLSFNPRLLLVPPPPPWRRLRAPP